MPMSLRSSTASPEPNEQYSPTANDFPRQAGQTISVSKAGNRIVSPAPSSLSFDPDDSGSNGISFTPDLIEEKKISRNVMRGAPGDAALMAMVKRDQEGTSLSRRKSQFYGEVFAYRESNVSARNKIHQYSVITAEVKTNVIVKDEYVFLADLSQHLSQRYHRPTSSIFITLTHSACLLYAGTFDSAYILTLTALPSQIQPTTNKRNAALIQRFLSDSLGVSPDRGIVRFVGIAEEFLATNGTTVLGEIENLSKTSSEDSPVDSHLKNGNLRTRARKTQHKPKELPLREDTVLRSGDAMPSPSLESPAMPPMPTELSPLDRKAKKVQKMGRRKSFLSMFGKS